MSLYENSVLGVSVVVLARLGYYINPIPFHSLSFFTHVNFDNPH